MGLTKKVDWFMGRLYLVGLQGISGCFSIYFFGKAPKNRRKHKISKNPDMRASEIHQKSFPERMGAESCNVWPNYFLSKNAKNP